MEKKEVAIREKNGMIKAALQPGNFQELMQLCAVMSKSAIVPKDLVGKPENCAIAIMFGMELGLSVSQSVSSIMIINGRPSLWGDAVLALVIDSGLCELLDEDTPDKALAQGFGQIKVKRVGGLVKTYKFSMEDAKRANLHTKDPWKNYPGRMLQMRARSWALRDNFPDVLKGMMIREEAEDYGSEKSRVRMPTEVKEVKTAQDSIPATKIEKPSPIPIQTETSQETQKAEEIQQPQSSEAIKNSEMESDALEPVSKTITLEQRQELVKLLSVHKVDLAEWKEYVINVFNAGSSAEIPEDQFDTVKAWITAHHV